jgi:hypothetical protein
MKDLTKTLAALTLGAVVAVPTAFAGGLTAEQLAEERANLHADGSLPFVHSPEIYGSGGNEVIYTDEQVEELENLYADGSLPFVHSPTLFDDTAVASDVVWTDEQIAEFRNLRSDGSLL